MRGRKGEGMRWENEKVRLTEQAVGGRGRKGGLREREEE